MSARDGGVRRRARWPWLVAALGAGAALYVASASRTGAPEGCLRACAAPGERRPGPLRVWTFNVRHGFPRFHALETRLLALAEAARARDADVLLLQEVPWTPTLGGGAGWLARRIGLNHVSLRANGNRWTIAFEEGIAVLSRFPIAAVDSAELAPRAGFFEGRVVLHARLETPDGPLDAFCTHLTNGAPAVNRGQGEALRAFVDARAGPRFVVGGDLNAEPDAPQIRALAERWRDVWRAARGAELGPTCCDPPGPLSRRIDYLFVPPSARVRAAERLFDAPLRLPSGPLRASDHAGVSAELSFPAAGLRVP